MTDDENRKLLWELVEEIKVCMMATQSEDAIHARPMHGRVVAEESAIWFITDQRSSKETEILGNPKVCLSYADHKRHNYVSISGTVEIVTDKSKIAAFWNDSVATYFSKPYDDQAALLKVTPESGEYWDSPSNPIVLAIKFIEAGVTGKRPDLGKNEKMDL